MFDAALWETLDRIHKEKTQKSIDLEWGHTQKNAQTWLIDAAQKGERRVTWHIEYLENVNRLVPTIRAMSGFTCEVVSTQTAGYKVNISF